VIITSFTTQVAQIFVHSLTTYQPGTKSNPNHNPNPDPTTEQHAIDIIQLNIVSSYASNRPEPKDYMFCVLNGEFFTQQDELYWVDGRHKCKHRDFQCIILLLMLVLDEWMDEFYTW